MGEGSRKQHNDWLYDMLIPSLFIQRNGYVYLYFIREGKAWKQTWKNVNKISFLMLTASVYSATTRVFAFRIHYILCGLFI